MSFRIKVFARLTSPPEILCALPLWRSVLSWRAFCFAGTRRQGVSELKSLRLILALFVVLGTAAGARAQAVVPASSQQVVPQSSVPPLPPPVAPDELLGLAEEQQPAYIHQGVLVEKL